MRLRGVGEGALLRMMVVSMAGPASSLPPTGFMRDIMSSRSLCLL